MAFTVFFAFELVPAERTLRPGCPCQIVSAVGLRHWLRLHIKRMFTKENLRLYFSVYVFPLFSLFPNTSKFCDGLNDIGNKTCILPSQREMILLRHNLFNKNVIIRQQVRGWQARNQLPPFWPHPEGFSEQRQTFINPVNTGKRYSMPKDRFMIFRG